MMGEDQQAKPAANLSSFGWWRLTAALAAATFVGAQILHELGHLLVFLLRGRSPVWGTSSIVQLSDRTPQTPEDWSIYIDPDGNPVWLRVDTLPTADTEWIVFFLAGPTIQFLAIAVGLYVFHRSTAVSWRRIGLLLVLVNSFGMALTYSVSLLRGASGDEYLSGLLLGIPSVALVLVFLLLSALALAIGLRSSGPARERLRVGVMLLLTNIVLGPAIYWANGMIREGVDAGNALLRPLFGFSAPVILAALLAIAILWWAMTERRAAPNR